MIVLYLLGAAMLAGIGYALLRASTPAPPPYLPVARAILEPLEWDACFVDEDGHRALALHKASGMLRLVDGEVVRSVSARELQSVTRGRAGERMTTLVLGFNDWDEPFWEIDVTVEEARLWCARLRILRHKALGIA